MDSETQKHIAILLSQPLAVLAAIVWLLGITIFLTWWMTQRIMKFATWKGVSAAVQSSEDAVNKSLKDHKDDDIRMFDNMANRMQTAMETSAEKFKDGMELTAKYLQQVTSEQQAIREDGRKTSDDLHEIKGALKVLLPKEQAEKIFREIA